MDGRQDQFCEGQNKETSHFARMQPVDFLLTAEQHMIIQHHLPKRYSLIDFKNIKRSFSSVLKLGGEENVSRLSGNAENTEQIEGRHKRVRTKKVDKYLEDEMPKISKRASIDVNPEDEFAQCFHILNLLKRHKNAQPFSRPVNPEADNVPDYLEIIKEPKDFSTIETNLIGRKYANAAQFHADICKIWSNGYLYNKKNSIIYKYTVQMQKYYKSLIGGEERKVSKQEKYKTKNMKKEEKKQERREDYKKEESSRKQDYSRMGLEDTPNIASLIEEETYRDIDREDEFAN